MISDAIFEQSLREIKLDREAEAGLSPLPERMINPPFGLDSTGNLIKQSRSSTLIGVVEELKASTARHLQKELSTSFTPEERATRVEDATKTAEEELVRKLNLAMPDPSYRVSAESLLNKNNYYSYEFSLFANDYAAEIAGDGSLFYYLRGVKSVPAAMLNMVRPLSLAYTYSILPRFSSKQTAADIRVTKIGDNFVHVEWHSERQLLKVPPELQGDREMCLQAGMDDYVSKPIQIKNLVTVLENAATR